MQPPRRSRAAGATVASHATRSDEGVNRWMDGWERSKPDELQSNSRSIQRMRSEQEALDGLGGASSMHAAAAQPRLVASSASPHPAPLSLARLSRFLLHPSLVRTSDGGCRPLGVGGVAARRPVTSCMRPVWSGWLPAAAPSCSLPRRAVHVSKHAAKCAFRFRSLVSQ